MTRQCQLVSKIKKLSSDRNTPELVLSPPLYGIHYDGCEQSKQPTEHDKQNFLNRLTCPLLSG